MTNQTDFTKPLSAGQYLTKDGYKAIVYEDRTGYAVKGHRMRGGLEWDEQGKHIHSGKYWNDQNDIVANWMEENI